MLWASVLLKEQWGTEPEAQSDEGDMPMSTEWTRTTLAVDYFETNIMHEPERWMEVNSEVTMHAICQYTEQNKLMPSADNIT